MNGTPLGFSVCPQDSPAKNTGVGCHFLLQGTFPTQRFNLRLLHCQADSLPLSRQEVIRLDDLILMAFYIMFCTKCEMEISIK